MSITVRIENHIEERGDGSSIEWPQYDLIANPGDIVLANSDTDPIAISYATDQIDDSSNPVSLTFGAYYDPSLAAPPFATANGTTGTFSVIIAGTTYTGNYAGPYCAIPPKVWDLDDDGFAWAEPLAKVEYNTDTSTGKYAIHQEASTDPQVHGDNLHDDAVHRAKTHPSDPGRHHWHGLTHYFSGTTSTGPYTGTFTWLSKDASTKAELRDSSGRLIHEFALGASSSVTGVKAGDRIVYNAPASAGYTPPGGARSATVTDGTTNWTVLSNSFDSVGPGADLGTADGLLLYEFGRVDPIPDADTGELHMITHHAGNMQFGGQHLGNRSVNKDKLNSGTALPNYVATSNGDKTVDYKDPSTNPLLTGVKHIKTKHDGTILDGPTVTIGGKRGFYVQSDTANEVDIYPPDATADGQVLTWNSATGEYEAQASGSSGIVKVHGDDGYVTGSDVYINGVRGFFVHQTSLTQLEAGINAGTTAGEYLRWNGSTWTHATFPTIPDVRGGLFDVVGDGSTTVFPTGAIFSPAFAGTPHIVICPQGSNAVGGFTWAVVSESTTGFSITCNPAPPNLQHFNFNYIAVYP